MKWIPVSIPAFLIAAAFPVAHADTQIELEGVNNARSGTISIKGDKVLLQEPNGPGRMVMDTTREALFMIDDTRKQYVVINEDTLATTTSMMSMMQQAMLAQIQSLPEGERKAIEQRLGLSTEAAQTSTVKVDKTGKYKTLHGVKCEVTNILTDDKLTGGACVATPEAAGIALEDYNTLKKMFSISRKMAEKTSKLSRGMPGNFNPEMFPDIDGIPMETKDFTHDATLAIKTISNTTLSAASFEPGNDYQLFDPVQMMEEQMKLNQPGSGY